MKGYGSTAKSGTVNDDLNFDGYTCTDNKEKLYMTDKNSYASTSFALNSALSAYTVEFWIKPNKKVIGNAFHLALQETSK
jgi:hypothetical protein